MKKHLSVFYLIARESIYKLFFSGVLFFALQSAIYYAVNKDFSFVFSSLGHRLDSKENFTLILVFYAALLLFSLLLIKTGMQFNSKSGYTLRRLRINEKWVFIHQGIYNFLMLMLFFILEVLIMYVLVSFTVAGASEKAGPQAVYITFYESAFLQNIFAGRDALRAVRNIICIFSYSVNLSAFSYLSRYGKKWIPVFIFAALLYIPFAGKIDMTQLEYDVAYICISVIMLYAAAAFVFIRRNKDEI